MKTTLLTVSALILLAACSRKSSPEGQAPDREKPTVVVTPTLPDDNGTPLVKPTEPKVKLGPNDVSILFPYLQIKSLYSLMPEFRAFFPDTYLALIDATLKANDPNADINTTLPRIGDNPSFFTYRMVSLRFDACANVRELPTDGECRRELRAVFQRVVDAGNGEFFFEDNMIHTTNLLSRDDFQAIVKSLRALKSQVKVDTTDEALQPNPTIAAEGLGSPYFKGVMTIVRDYVRADTLFALAYFANTNRTTGNWPMLKFARSDKELVPFLIPNTNGANVQRMFGRLAFTAPTPLASEADDIFTESNAEALAANALRLEDPMLHSAHDTDCASCHRADLERNRALKTPSGPALSLQMFSYFDTSVKIAPRVVKSSADICEMINADKI